MWKTVDKLLTPHAERAKRAVDGVGKTCGQMCMTLRQAEFFSFDFGGVERHFFRAFRARDEVPNRPIQ